MERDSALPGDALNDEALGSWLNEVAGALYEYLLDPQSADWLARKVASDAGIPLPLVRYAFRILALLAEDAHKAACGWLGTGVGRLARTILLKLPYSGLLCRKLGKWLHKLQIDVEAKEALAHYLAGALGRLDPELVATLPLDLRQGLAALEGLDGIGRQITELRVALAALSEDFARLLDRAVNPPPVLALPALEVTPESVFRFDAEWVEFFGREPEMARLREFLDNPARLSWWLVTGPGGAGKSRLALELCRRLTGWRAGFLNVESWSERDNERWQPLQPTLMIIDYAGRSPTAVGRLIASLASRSTSDRPLEAPVRLLLLERETGQAWWWSELNRIDPHLLRQSCHAAKMEPLVIAKDPCERAALAWHTITHFHAMRDRSPPDRETTLETLRGIDDQLRPLFAAFAGDALAQGRSIRSWDRDRLFEDVLSRQRDRFWLPALGGDAARLGRFEWLLALATMMGGTDNSLLDAPPAKIPLPAPDDPDLATAYATMSGRACPYDADACELGFPKLEPDILGAFFVLAPKTGEFGNPRLADIRWEGLRGAMWSRGEAESTKFWLFLNRAKDDFLDHPRLDKLLYPPPEASGPAFLWSQLAVNLIGAYGDRDRTEDALRCFGLLQDLSEEHHPADPQFGLSLAMGAFGLLMVHRKAGRDDKVADCLQLLRDVSERRFPEDREIACQFAQGVVNSIGPSDDKHHLDAMPSRLALLSELSDRRFASDLEIAISLAIGTYNIVNAFGRANRLEGASHHLGRLRFLADQRFPKEREIAGYLFLAARGLLRSLRSGSTERWDEMERCIEIMRAVADRHWAGDGVFALDVIRQAFALFLALDASGRRERAAWIAQSFRGEFESASFLASDCPPDLRERLTRRLAPYIEASTARGRVGNTPV